MSLFFFGGGLLFIQIPDAGLKKVSLETQFFNMNKSISSLWILTADCNYSIGMAEPSHMITERRPNLNNTLVSCL